MNTAVSRYYHLDVDVTPERAGQVSRILAAHLRLWNLESLVRPVCHGAELLLHAIDEHATGTKAAIEMWWTGRHHITAVEHQDRGPLLDEGWQDCLARIAALSDGWGHCTQDTEDGGEVIWFSRRVGTEVPVPLSPAVPALPARAALRVPRGERPVPALVAVDTPPDALDEPR
ncbi:pep a2 [Streptomyces beihaiensis]|uniref:Pep a2 n=1 Tax=Streptomyces beihaiensis TaxID=2984495 RepID=A0ABT3TWP7_9ACTN|nr:pep a2 [Streptomyces beihaiensis]MCX3060807.1 pep a2 [Streptomyces beihaiensis]